MKFCEDHFRRFPSTFSDEKINSLISEFINEMVNPIELQDKIDRRKDQCVVCFFRKEGTIKLKKMIKKNNKKSD